MGSECVGKKGIRIGKSHLSVAGRLESKELQLGRRARISAPQPGKRPESILRAGAAGTASGGIPKNTWSGQSSRVSLVAGSDQFAERRDEATAQPYRGNRCPGNRNGLGYWLHKRGRPGW